MNTAAEILLVVATAVTFVVRFAVAHYHARADGDAANISDDAIPSLSRGMADRMSEREIRGAWTADFGDLRQGISFRSSAVAGGLSYPADRFDSPRSLAVQTPQLPPCSYRSRTGFE